MDGEFLRVDLRSTDIGRANHKGSRAAAKSARSTRCTRHIKRQHELLWDHVTTMTTKTHSTVRWAVFCGVATSPRSVPKYRSTLNCRNLWPKYVPNILRASAIVLCRYLINHIILPTVIIIATEFWQNYMKLAVKTALGTEDVPTYVSASEIKLIFLSLI